MASNGSLGFAQDFLPQSRPVTVIDQDGCAASVSGQFTRPADSELALAYRLMVLGRRFDVQATNLAKQGRLAVYAPSIGQEACQIGAALDRQSAAPSLAYKGIGYGMRSEQVDGNDVAAVLAVLREAVAAARRDGTPFLVEAHTYRMEGHTKRRRCRSLSGRTGG